MSAPETSHPADRLLTATGDPNHKIQDPQILFERDPTFYGGRPMIPGTGIPAWLIAELLQAGATIADCLEAYPCLTLTSLSPYVSALASTPPETLGAPTDPWAV